MYYLDDDKVKKIADLLKEQIIRYNKVREDEIKVPMWPSSNTIYLEIQARMDVICLIGGNSLGLELYSYMETYDAEEMSLRYSLVQGQNTENAQRHSFASFFDHAAQSAIERWAD